MNPFRADVLRSIETITAKLRPDFGPVSEAHTLDADLELDSIERMTLAVELEDTWQVTLDEVDELSIRSVRDLIDAVERRTFAS